MIHGTVRLCKMTHLVNKPIMIYDNYIILALPAFQSVINAQLLN